MFSEDRDQADMPFFVSYLIYDDYNVLFTNGLLAALINIYFRFFSCLEFLLYYLRFFACMLCFVCLRYNNNHMYDYGTP